MLEAMYTTSRFKAEWQRRHNPAMDLSGDVDFYYDVYRRLHRIAGRGAGLMRDGVLIDLLMYIENNATVGLDPQYEMMYRSIGDLVGHWCKALGAYGKDGSAIYSCVAEAVAAAPAEGSLRRWIKESVLSGDFRRLEDMAIFFVRKDSALRLLFHNLGFSEKRYMELAGSERASALRMYWSDMAFNWLDKKGLSILRRLAGRFRRAECENEVAGNLLTVAAEQLNVYLPRERNGGRTLALVNRDGRVFNDVMFSAPLPKGYEGRCFIGLLAAYLGHTYVIGSGAWCDRDVFARWNSGMLWQKIDSVEKENATNTVLTMPFGKKESLSDGLPKTPQSPEDAYCSDLGIYIDEPNVLDFLDWLKPAERSFCSNKTI